MKRPPTLAMAMNSDMTIASLPGAAFLQLAVADGLCHVHEASWATRVDRIEVADSEVVLRARGSRWDNALLTMGGCLVLLRLGIGSVEVQVAGTFPDQIADVLARLRAAIPVAHSEEAARAVPVTFWALIGLGNATADFTDGAGGGATGIPLTDALLDLLGLDQAERAQLRKIGGRGAVLGPLTQMRTVGMNPAELFAVILMVHHDRATLAWSDTPLAPLVPVDAAGAPIADPRVTSDPPPWWRAHKKNALFYNGMARGDHRGTMALATSVCVDDIPRARVVDEQFRHIQAFVRSVRAPAWPRALDQTLAAQGKTVFDRDCGGCHGSYGAREEDDTYPNLLIPLDVAGTDPVVANAGVVHSPELVEWYNGSFYGSVTRMVPSDPFPGYMPPPLDGIWATAPYLHNGSVPTVELVLNSRARPLRWRRVDIDSRNIDETALGWPWVPIDVPQEQVPEAERKFVYDTTYWSQANTGHPFGDHLTAAERRAVIEYLKTL